MGSGCQLPRVDIGMGMNLPLTEVAIKDSYLLCFAETSARREARELKVCTILWEGAMELTNVTSIKYVSPFLPIALMSGLVRWFDGGVAGHFLQVLR